MNIIICGKHRTPCDKSPFNTNNVGPAWNRMLQMLHNVTNVAHSVNLRNSQNLQDVYCLTIVLYPKFDEEY